VSGPGVARAQGCAGLAGLRALAWSLPDVQPGPRAASTGAVRGAAPTSWELCPGCDGGGVVVDRFRRASTCSECAGAGRYRVDPMTEDRVSTWEAPAPARTRRVGCDRCGGGGVIPGRWVGATGTVRCPGCDGAGTVAVPVDVRPVGALVVDGDPLARLRALGDWGRLEAALAALHRRDRDRARTFTAARVGVPSAPAPGGAPPRPRAGFPLEPPQGVSQAVWEVECSLYWQLVPVVCPRDVVLAWSLAGRRAVGVEAARARRVYRPGRRAGRARELVRAGGVSIESAAASLGVSERSVRRALGGTA
jgi:hypothetical protein